MSASAPNRVVRRVEITNKNGLHARAARLVLEAAGPFDAEITVTKDDQTVNGRSILGLMMLAAGPRSVIEVAADGPDAQAAVDAIVALVEARFNEDA